MNYEDPEGVKKYRAKAEALTSPFALHLIRECGLDRADGSSELVILDNACGTGAVTVKLYETLSPAAKAKLQVVCGDLSPSMVKSVQERIEESGWAGASAKVVDAWRMDLPSNTFTHVITNFALPGFAEPRSFLAEAFRVLRPFGVNALTKFEHVPWYPISAAAIARIPGAPRVPSFKEFSQDEKIRRAGFEDVQCVLRQNVSKFPNAEEYLKIHGEITVIGMAWSEEEKARVRPHFQAALLEELKSRFGDGEIAFGLGGMVHHRQSPRQQDVGPMPVLASDARHATAMRIPLPVFVYDASRAAVIGDLVFFGSFELYSRMKNRGRGAELKAGAVGAGVLGRSSCGVHAWLKVQGASGDCYMGCKGENIEAVAVLAGVRDGGRDGRHAWTYGMRWVLAS
ncbi:S-adenosyl-L-methionine-dependent methyltransferase [Cerioporus squamosus]|nr:S-adenosyl-L-methionine-dependent methyltransferase [Cerioporus squamosus]